MNRDLIYGILIYITGLLLFFRILNSELSNIWWLNILTFIPSIIVLVVGIILIEKGFDDNEKRN